MLEMIEDRKGFCGLRGETGLTVQFDSSLNGEERFSKGLRVHTSRLAWEHFYLSVAGKPFASSTLDFPLSCGRGHETTASVLSFAIALLATHQEEQEELYKHVRSVVPDGRLPVRRGSCHDICSLYPIRPIKMFHDSLGFSRSSTRHYAFSLQ
jgi:hypothetical protein